MGGGVKAILLKIVLLIFGFVSCLYAEKIRVFASIPPQVFFIEKVGGDRVDAIALIEPGQSHETFSPSPLQIAKLADSKLYFRIGLSFENGLVERLKEFKSLKVVDMRDGIPRREMEKVHRDQTSDSHEEGHDPHIWMSPLLAIKQAETVKNELKEMDPAHASNYDANFNAFSRELRELHEKLDKVLKPYRGKEFFVFHPAFGYFADEFGLRQVSVEVEGKEPSARMLSKLIDTAKQHHVGILFYQPQFSKKSVEAISREIGAIMVPMDPLSKDYEKNLETMAQEIARAMKQQNG